MRSLLTTALLLLFTICRSQQSFPQTQINSALQNSFGKQIRSSPAIAPGHNSSGVSAILQKIEELKKSSSPVLTRSSQPQPAQPLALDTLIVGFLPNDTVIITGNWTHTGPIWVLGNGVLIFDNANVIDTGDVYVFGSGKWIADSSSFFFPQAYFYERLFVAVQDASVHFGDCSLNYSGMSHQLAIGDSAYYEWINVQNNDWTTCGLYGGPTVNINGSNLSGEYILNDSSITSFTNADSIILWHQMPQTAVVNYAFPPGDTVYNYVFNNSTPGVSGVNYSTQADSCHTVWWALMPVNGSDVTISNSDIRLIGAWFERGDTASAYGIFNNSSYVNYTTPLSDRNLQLNNTTVGTWSLYVFDSSFVSIDSCQLGEVGTQQQSTVVSTDFILDGSGGYFWATDSSFTSAANVISYSTCRSEKEATFLLAYSWLPFAAPMAVHNSSIICVQNTLVADPVPYDGAVAWLANMDGPDTASVNATFPITGSAWINQGPNGNPVDFGSYSLYYQLPSVSANWYAIAVNALTEVSNNTLANWNTNGLQPGTYLLKLVLKNNFGDSAEGLKIIELLPNPVNVQEIPTAATVTVYPNPSDGKFTFSFPAADGELTVYNMLGEVVFRKAITGELTEIDFSGEAEGVYSWKFLPDAGSAIVGKMVVR